MLARAGVLFLLAWPWGVGHTLRLEHAKALMLAQSSEALVVGKLSMSQQHVKLVRETLQRTQQQLESELARAARMQQQIDSELACVQVATAALAVSEDGLARAAVCEVDMRERYDALVLKSQERKFALSAIRLEGYCNPLEHHENTRSALRA